MAVSSKQKLTTKVLEQLSKTPPADNVFDTELPGFHVRPGKRGLTFRLFYRTKTGRQRILTLGRYGTLTAAQARKDANEALAIVAQGGDPRAVMEQARAEEERQQQQTILAYLDGPYAVAQRRKKDGDATMRRIKHAFDGWLSKPMSDLTRADIERWQGEREAKGEAYTTSKRHLGALKTMLAHAADRKVILTNPLARINLQRPAMTEEAMVEQASQRRYLEAEEVEALFAGIEAYQEAKRKQRRSSRAHGKAYLPSLDDVAYVDHVAPWTLTMYYTGFRPGDLFGLRWDHVNLDFRTIRKVIEKTAHHHSEPMTFPLSAAAVDVLKEWHRQQGEPKTGLVFPSQRNGKRMSQTAMQKPWATIRKLAGLPDDLVLYSLRHNFASQLVMAGIDLLTVSKLMAHSDIQTTIQHYAHLRPNHSRDAVEVFARQTASQGADRTDTTEGDVHLSLVR
ncbi:site-specific integrase [Halomonas vilamensis]|uniref:Site-specific integrase n=1 Tax=Vreelandella vilamensis TaxID=531309 RepID=A0ABU1H6Q2_9GAMM|nr:site-specific integrase [Halomonas vilamensis]MDR5899974.1 site-specific integrase [Halomonas vilamensis]